MLNNKAEKYSSIFKWNNGKLFAYYLINGEVASDEIAYVHLQKRKMHILVDKYVNKFLIVPNKFITSTDVEGILKRQKPNQIYLEYKKNRVRMIINHVQQHAIQ